MIIWWPSAAKDLSSWLSDGFVILDAVLVISVCVSLNLHLPNGLSHPHHMDESICYLRGSGILFSFLSYL